MKHVGLRVEDDVFAALMQRAHKAGVSSVQAAAVAAIQAWSGVEADLADVPAKYRDHPRKLVEILRSGDEPIIHAVAANIDVFHNRLRPVAAVRKVR